MFVGLGLFDVAWIGLLIIFLEVILGDGGSFCLFSVYSLFFGYSILVFFGGFIYFWFMWLGI